MFCRAIIFSTLAASFFLIRTARSFSTVRQLRSFHHHSRSMRAEVASYVTPDEAGIAQSAALLQAGGLVAFPTETVYGLGANALNAASVASIFTAKGRPLTDPLIVHVLDRDSIYQLFNFGANKQAQLICETLCDAFWPGPLTIIFRASATVPPLVTANTGFVGLRAPRHAVCRRLLAAANLPIAAPSANRFGHVSPTSAAHVMTDLQHVSNLLIMHDESDSGGCSVGIESTVCRVAEDGAAVSVLRCGAVTTEAIRSALAARGVQCAVSIANQKLVALDHGEESAADTVQAAAEAVVEEVQAVAPGQMIKHYSPDLPTFILAATDTATAQTAVCGSGVPPSTLSTTMVLDFGARLAHLQPLVACYVDLSASGDAAAACQTVFHYLRYAEGDEVRQMSVTVLVLPDLRQASAADEGVRALWERLNRAASGAYATLSS